MENFGDLQRAGALNVNSTYSFSNNPTFYALANRTYYDYYYRIIRRCAWWLDGYDPEFHRSEQGIFSTRIGATLTKGVANTIVGEKMLFKLSGGGNENQEIIDFISKDWQKGGLFQEAVRNAIKYAVGLGTSLLKINKSSSGLWLEALRLDYFYFSTDFKGELNETVCLIKHYTDALPKSDSIENYYLVERRYFKYKSYKELKEINGKKSWFTCKKRIPMVEYCVKLYQGNTLSYQAYDPSMVQNISWDSLNKRIKSAILKDYGIIRINEPQQLPFSDYLGCELIKYDDGDVSLPQTMFGTPMIYDILSYLMMYELSIAYATRDMYLGKGIVLLPKPMSMTGQTYSPYQGLDKTMYEFFDTVDPDKQTPKNIQFNLRGEEWEKIQDNLLKKIATSIGMSPKTIASYLSVGMAQKTATEVDSEDDATVAFIDIRRGNFAPKINKILKCITNYYGKAGTVEVKFATPSLVNKDKLINRAIALLESGLADEMEALKMIYPDDDEQELRRKCDNLKVYREKRLNVPNPLGDNRLKL